MYAIRSYYDSYERHPEHPAHHAGRNQRSQPGTDSSGKAVIDQRREQDAENDRRRPAKFRREDEGQQLGFVTDFSQCNDACRNEKCVHEWCSGLERTRSTIAPSPL